MTELDPDGAAAEKPMPDDVEPTGDGAHPRTTTDLWTLLHDDSTWHDRPDPIEP